MTDAPECIPWGEAGAHLGPTAGRGQAAPARDPTAEERKRAGAVLARGGLVVLPTETVYGIAARADHPQAMERLRAVKTRASSQALTWHIGSLQALARLPRVSPLAERLMARYWPGPLTLVMPGVARGLERATSDGWTGVRFPAQKSTAALLAELEFPVVATSANRRGEPALTDAASVLRHFGAQVDLCLDGGPPRLRESSVVLKVGPGHFEVLREGILDLDKLRQAAGLKLGFLCTGNTCRSPMAEGLARRLLAERLRVREGELARFGFELSSFGVLASYGAPAADHAVAVLAEQGVDLSRHSTHPATPEELAKLDRVYGMSRSHLDSARLMLPPGNDKHCVLLDPEGGDVGDPMGGTREDYAACAAQIRELLEKRLDEWV
jgi:tRNA threonylcarbamoyl adenosine modification protein (Sua5/YciO/YrdC/YwlC family)